MKACCPAIKPVIIKMWHILDFPNPTFVTAWVGLSLRLISTWWLLISLGLNRQLMELLRLESRNTKLQHQLVGDVCFSFEISWRDKSAAEYEWCKNSMLMRMWLKLNNHLHSKQKRSCIMQMSEAFMLFRAWEGFCEIQETVTQRGETKREKFQTASASLSHFSSSTVNTELLLLQFYPVIVQWYLWI